VADDQSDTPGFDDPSEFQSPAWWLKHLTAALLDRKNGRAGSKQWSRMSTKPTRIRPGLDTLHDYLRGDPPLTGYADAWGDSFRYVTRMARLNVSENIVNSKAGRMRLRGFRTAAEGDELGDKIARNIMRVNKFKVLSREIHRNQLWAADAYGMVTPPKKTAGIPIITSEDPRETITAHDAATGETLAALKLYRDDWDASDVAHMFIRQADGSVLHYPLRKSGKMTVFTTGAARFIRGWELEPQGVGKLSRMPIIRFPNRGGRGEYEWHLDTVDRINDEIMDKLVIAKVQAFRQMAVKNLPDTAIKMVDGQPHEVEIDYSNAFEATPGALWRLPADSDMWESTPTDLGPLRLAIKDDLQDLAGATQTSLPSMTPDAASGSAEGAALMREKEVDAAQECIDYADGSWAELMSTAFAFMDDEERADIAQLEPMWGPVERYSLSEKAEADSKAGSLPIEIRWTDIWQYDPADVPRLRQLKGADLLSNPVTPPSGSPGGNGVPQVTFTPPAQGGQGGSAAAQ
jgi:hypothetical protein